MIKKLAKFIGKYKVYAILTPLLVMVETIGELMLPNMMSNIVDIGVQNSDKAYMFRTGAIMLGIAVISLLGGLYSAKTAVTASQGFGAELRKKLYSQVQKFSFADIDRFSTASLVTRLTNDVKTVQQIVQMMLRVLVRAPSLMIVGVAIVFSHSWKLALIYLVALPVLFVIIRALMNSVHYLFKKAQESMDNLNSTVQENLIAIRVVKSFVRENYERKKFKKVNDAYTDSFIRALTINILINPFSTLILNAVTICLYWFGGNFVGAGELDVGELMAIITYLNQIMMSVMMFSMVLMDMSRAKACATRIIEVLDTEPSVVDPEIIDDEADMRIKGGIEFKNVDFRYPATNENEYILHNVSFSAEPGQTVAVIGGTGSGKSSLVNLIPRFYDACGGQVLIDGRDVRDYGIHNLRENIGMVLQKNVLFTGTIRDNMKWGNSDATDEEICAALRDAQAYDFVMSFPDKLDTMIVQGGTNVSGGQKQRLCIARAMLKKPKILILDDSTSAVDSDTESRIRHSFSTTLKDCTVIIIAQRISSVSGADKIVVLDDGQIESVGNHRELMSISPIYQEIYTSQQEGGKIGNG